MALLENRIREVRRAAGLSQQKLADLVGSHWVTISKLERGEQQLTWTWVQRIATALSVEPSALMVGEKVIASTVIVGCISEDGVLGVYPEDTVSTRYVFSSLFDSHTDDWVDVQGDVLWPFFHDGDIVCVTHTNRPSEEFLGRFCWFKPFSEPFGKIGILSRGSTSGKFNLQIGGKPPIADLEGEVKGYVSMAAFNLPVNMSDQPILQNMESRLSLEETAREMGRPYHPARRKKEPSNRK